MNLVLGLIVTAIDLTLLMISFVSLFSIEKPTIKRTTIAFMVVLAINIAMIWY